MSILTYLIAFPFLGALIVAFIPRERDALIRGVAIAASVLSVAAALIMFIRFDPGQAGYQFEQTVRWVTVPDVVTIQYHVGVDGVNLGLLLMGALVAFAAIAVSWDIQSRRKEFYALALIMSAGILGAFASLDLFLLYFFHELALVPTFIMIGVWGRGENRQYAAFKITLYLSLGALIALVGLIALYLAVGAETFDIAALTAAAGENPIASGAQHLIFPMLLFGFGILVSLWPFHTWAPLGYASAPTATAMMHAGVLKKFGLYALIRIALPLLPEGAATWMPVLAWLCLGNILFCGLVAMRQKDLNYLIGNSSVAHMGFVFLGIASLTLTGVSGAVMVMIAHGLLAALSFGLSGFLYHQQRHLEIARMGGLLKQLPFVGTALFLAMMAGCGLPGFANFAGEVMVFFGAWDRFPLVTAFACWGALVIGAVYMLRAIRAILHGAPVPAESPLVDAPHLWRRLPYAVLVIALLVFGFFPRLLTDRINPAAQAILDAGGYGPTAESRALATTTSIPSIGENTDRE